MANIILVGGIKGGTGKTTVAVNLAVAHALTSEAAALGLLCIDADDQANFNRWATFRTECEYQPHIQVTRQQGKGLSKTLRSFAEKYETIIVDAGGYDSTELRETTLVADTWLIPVVVSQFNVDTFEYVEQILGQVNAIRPESLTASLFVSQGSTYDTSSERAALREAAADFDRFEVLNSQIRNRIIFKKAENAAVGVAELGGKHPSGLRSDGKAGAEIASLYAEVFEHTFKEKAA